MYRVFIGFGSNVGNRLSHMREALKGLSSVLRIEGESSVYETEPVGFLDQPPFLNMVVEGATEDDPKTLLRKLKDLEKRCGRVAMEHMRPREIDLDILLYENMQYNDHQVTVPHPELAHRRFALEPLAELAGNVRHPVLGKTISELLMRCNDGSSVVRVGPVYVDNGSHA